MPKAPTTSGKMATPSGNFGGGPLDVVACADSLHRALQGFGTDEDAVWRELGRVRTVRDWAVLQHAFRDRHPDDCGGNLRRALEEDLTKSELQRAKDILARHGIPWDGAGDYAQPQQPPATSPKSAYRPPHYGYPQREVSPPPEDPWTPRRQGAPPAPQRPFDHRDRAPEDRAEVSTFLRKQRDGSDWLADTRLREFDLYDLLVRGSLILEGVNYAKYEQVRETNEDMRMAFIDAIKDDIIGEVGNGVRREDIAVRVYPGQIKAVVLHYDKRMQGDTPPSLVDAEWSIRCDYAIRTKEQQRQRNIAVSLYTTFRSPVGFRGECLKRVYGRMAGPEGRAQDIAISCPGLEKDGDEAPQPQHAPRAHLPLQALSPTRPPSQQPAPQLPGAARAFSPTGAPHPTQLQPPARCFAGPPAAGWGPPPAAGLAPPPAHPPAGCCCGAAGAQQPLSPQPQLQLPAHFQQQQLPAPYGPTLQHLQRPAWQPPPLQQQGAPCGCAPAGAPGSCGAAQQVHTPAPAGGCAAAHGPVPVGGATISPRAPSVGRPAVAFSGTPPPHRPSHAQPQLLAPPQQRPPGDPYAAREQELDALARAIEQERTLLQRARAASLSPGSLQGTQEGAHGALSQQERQRRRARAMQSPRNPPQPPVVGTRVGDADAQGRGRRGSPRGLGSGSGCDPPSGTEGSYSTHEF